MKTRPGVIFSLKNRSSDLMRSLIPALLFLSILSFQACTSTGTVSETQAPPEAATDSRTVPEWYTATGITSDSLEIRSVAVTLSGDSLNAAATAEKEARMQLEKYAGDILEDIRLNEASSGQSSLNNSAFIFELRQAHQKVEENALVQRVSVINTDPGFRGFAEVYISRSELEQLLSDELSGYSEELQILMGSEDFGRLGSL